MHVFMDTNKLLSSNLKKHDIEKELENIFIGSESNGEKTEEQYNSLDDKSEMKWKKALK